MSGSCASLPAINNGKVIASSTNQAEYECLSGFTLVGNKVINCNSATGWETAPTCQVIDQTDNVYTWGPEWLMIILGIILCLILLSIIGCIVWACCCRRRENGPICFDMFGRTGRSQEKNDLGDGELSYNESAGVYTMDDGTMFIPVRPYHEGVGRNRGLYDKRGEEIDDGFFSCCGRKRSTRRRQSADMVYDESEGVYTLKDGTMYTPIRPQKTTGIDGKSTVWHNSADTSSKTWYHHQGVFAGDISGPKKIQYDPKNVQKYSKEDFYDEKQNGHWFLGNQKASNNKNRTLVTTTINDKPQKSTTIYVVDEDPLLNVKSGSSNVQAPPIVTPKSITVQGPALMEPNDQGETRIIHIKNPTTKNPDQVREDGEKKTAPKPEEKPKVEEAKDKDGGDDGKKQGKTKSDTKIVVINVNKGKSKPKTEDNSLTDKIESGKPIPKNGNYLTKSLDERVYTPSETDTRDTFSMTDVNDIINSALIKDIDSTTDDDEPPTTRINPDAKFVDSVNRELILEKMRKKKRNDKVWIPHSHPVRNTKHFTK